MPKIKIAVIAPVCQIAQPQANLDHFTSWIHRAADAGGELICLPEMALSGYADDVGIIKAAEPVPGPSTDYFGKLARQLKVYISVGMLEQRGEKRFNSQVLIGPEGYIGHFSKMYPCTPEVETLGISPGTEAKIYDVKGIRFGMNICADSRQIDPLGTLVEQGVELLHNPHSNNISSSNKVGLGGFAEEWERGKVTYYLHRIAQSRCHMIVHNMAGSVKDTQGNTRTYCGGALILDPLGQVVKRSEEPGNEESMVVAEIDTDLAKVLPPFEWRHEPLKSIPRIKALLEA